MLYKFKDLILISYSEFLDENENQDMTTKIKYFSIRGKIIPIKKTDYERVAGGQRKIKKRSKYKIATDNNGNKFYVPAPPKQGMVLDFDPTKNKFRYKFDLQAYKIRKKIAKRVAKATAKKRAKTLKRTLALRR